METANLEAMVAKHGNERGGLIAILEEIQGNYGYLPEEALRLVARQTGRSLVDVYGVATFYRAFSLKPRGRHLVAVCLGTACHVRGGPRVAAEFERQLAVQRGETTADREFSLETVHCLGACALGPIVVVDGHYFSKVRPKEVKKIIARVREGLDKVEIEGEGRVFPLEVSCPRCHHSLMDKDYPIDGYPSVKVTAAFGKQHGWLRLSCLYGSYQVASAHPIPPKEVVHFFCPHCNGELAAASRCANCDAPMVPLIAGGGGLILICARRGCREHRLEMNGGALPAAVEE